MATKKNALVGALTNLLKFSTDIAKSVVTDVILPQTAKVLRRRVRSK